MIYQPRGSGWMSKVTERRTLAHRAAHMPVVEASRAAQSRAHRNSEHLGNSGACGISMPFTALVYSRQRSLKFVTKSFRVF